MKNWHKRWKNFVNFLQENKIRNVSLDDLLLKFIFISVLVIATLWLMPAERPFEYSNLNVNSIAPEEIIAPFKFAIQKTPDELEKERQQANLSVPVLFDRNPDILSRQSLTLKQFQEELVNFLKRNNLDGQQRDDTLTRNTKVPVDSFLQVLNIKYSLQLNFDAFLDLYELQRENLLSGWFKVVRNNLSQMYTTGILDRSKAEFQEKQIVVSENSIETTYNPEDLLEIREANNLVRSQLQNQFPQNQRVLRLAEQILPGFLIPNLNYNEKITQTRKEEAVHDVPLTRGYVEQDERIIDSNEKITDEVYQKLRSLEIAQKERSATQQGWQQIKFHGGRLLFALTMIFLTVVYLYYYRRQIFRNNLMVGMITLIFLIELFLAGLVEKFTDWSQLTVPIILAPMLLAMLLDFGVAFISVVTLGLILGSTLAYDYQFTFMALIVGSVSIFSVQKIRNRRQMFRAIFYILMGYFLVHLIFGLMHYKPINEIFTEFIYYLLPNAILTPTIVYFMIGIFERFFDVTTDISLLELSDLNHPLLKQLSVKAPGSFHHSIVVANLAEAGALAIRANALLTRVGCYFHDVGKMDKPEYFVENQHGGINKHDNLSPHMSYLILVNHVKEGLKMAEKHKLPNAVRQFVAEHHGTTVVSYFYNKAIQNADETEVRESDFRYPGPMPQSKETAICMLADTVEAASRTLKDPSPQRIRNIVEQLVDHKIKESQLDECDLTFKEIDQIKEAFIPILTGIHHLRIEYPESDKEKKGSREKNGKPAETSREKQQPKEKSTNGDSKSSQTDTPNPEIKSDSSHENNH